LKTNISPLCSKWMFLLQNVLYFRWILDLCKSYWVALFSNSWFSKLHICITYKKPTKSRKAIRRRKLSWGENIYAEIFAIFVFSLSCLATIAFENANIRLHTQNLDYNFIFWNILLMAAKQECLRYLNFHIFLSLRQW